MSSVANSSPKPRRSSGESRAATEHSDSQSQSNAELSPAVASAGAPPPKLNGVFAVFKPSGVTSAAVVAAAKRTLNPISKHTAGGTGAGSAAGSARQQRSRLRVGHGGTLDLSAAGVLVLGVGAGTKQLSAMLSGAKEYEAVIAFGFQSATHDLDGCNEATEQSEREMSEAVAIGATDVSRLAQRLRAAGVRVGDLDAASRVTREQVESFLSSHYASSGGLVHQTPPLYSALKSEGQRMSSLARAAASSDDEQQLAAALEAKARPVRVDSIRVQQFEMRESQAAAEATCASSSAAAALPSLVLCTLRIRCGGGFYVRSLARDLGEHFGCGALLLRLTRTQHAQFRLEQPTTMSMQGAMYLTKRKEKQAANVSAAAAVAPARDEDSVEANEEEEDTASNLSASDSLRASASDAALQSLASLLAQGGQGLPQPPLAPSLPFSRANVEQALATLASIPADPSSALDAEER